MGVIGVLDFSVANLIAAGEVVDRPGSVVKELMENAVDAGATQITVEIKRGGISFIRVSDNGCGMSREDAPISLMRHATSKIHTAEDLNKIFTLGFRGEALAAISAVSKLRILTRREEDSVGTVLYSEAGSVRSVSDAGCPIGTTIVVEELFYNVPARMKFLKKDATETANVVANVERLALSHPEISFRLICDGESRFMTPGDDNIPNALYVIFGRETAKKMTYVSAGETKLCSLSGYIGTPENVRSNRNLQLFYVNARYVRSKTMSAALEQAFTSYLPQDKFPCCVLYLTLHPDAVDVNVHPAKLEVKFSNERTVFELVYAAVRNALQHAMQRPQYEIAPTENKQKKEQNETVFALCDVEQKQKAACGNLAESVPDSAAQTEQLDLTQKQSIDDAEEPSVDIPLASWPVTSAPKAAMPFATKNFSGLPDAEQVHSAQISCTEEPQSVLSAVHQFVKKDAAVDADTQTIVRTPVVPSLTIPYRIVGELFDTYVIVEHKTSAYLIDKHAAHERILFEQLRSNAQTQNVQSFVLLLPVKVELSTEEAATALEFRDEIEKTGFRYGVDQKIALLQEIPSYMDVAQATAAFTELCGALSAGTAQASIQAENSFEKALYQAACKAAIKGGRTYDCAHIQWLCDKLFALPDIQYCPHGRPVCIELKKTSLEHRFKRS